MAIKLEMLRCFSVVAQAGSLAEAATRLGRTPSAISMTLRQLEDHLGQRLFETDRKNRLTPLGDYVLEQAQSELRQFDSTVRAIETFASTPGGLVRIAAVPSVAGIVFPPAIAAFSARHPNVRVELGDMDSAAILQALSRGQIDIGIATAAWPGKRIRSVPLLVDEFGLICANGHPLAQQAAAPGLDDLAAAKFIWNPLCRAIQDPRFHDRLADTTLSADNTLSLIAMVRSAGCVTVLPRSVLQIDPAGLAFRRVDGLNENRQVDLLFRDAASLPGYLTDCIDILQRTGASGAANDRD